ncbi:hypothetical protein QYE76_057094 [Lolium multiflorum]|uniref:RNase H type-1 domain-containing protein n=1 Tax=Lolium multiflorum TaxID=4521 RepID=A0AAD8WR44_LOLMU|nr:hypothetical protein QYE76_057094 [Lolium multiflorum]
MWAIWTSRNSWTHDRGAFDLAHSMKMAKEALAVLELPMKMTAMLPGHGWRPPDGDLIKINTDDDLSFEARRGGAGGVARTAYAFLGAWSKPYEGVADPLTAEALSLRDGVMFARLRGFTRVIMEVDCLEIVNLWNTQSDLLAPPMTGGNRSHRPLGTTAAHVPFEDLLYRGLEEGLVVAPPPRPRTSRAAGSRCNMFLGEGRTSTCTFLEFVSF